MRGTEKFAITTTHGIAHETWRPAKVLEKLAGRFGPAVVQIRETPSA